jgi:hypothetical protein
MEILIKKRENNWLKSQNYQIKRFISGVGNKNDKLANGRKLL